MLDSSCKASATIDAAPVNHFQRLQQLRQLQVPQLLLQQPARLSLPHKLFALTLLVWNPVPLLMAQSLLPHLWKARNQNMLDSERSWLKMKNLCLGRQQWMTKNLIWKSVSLKPWKLPPFQPKEAMMDNLLIFTWLSTLMKVV
jgi:hypothetical protein